jgi:malto-oligosyltrehalose trehalohydrolase
MTSPRFHQPLSFGAELQSGGDVRFRLWAPAAETPPVLVLEDGRETPLSPAGDGWFEARVAADAGARYRYRLADGLMVPDPASRAQHEDVHGWSEVIDPAGYTWRATAWNGRPWREVVLYELHVGALAGDFEGVIAELDRLKDLGITAVELMPVADFPGDRNWGYDGVLPYAPDRAYGGVAGLKRLVDAAHERGLMMFLDVVYNHFGPDGNYLHAYAPQFFAEEVHTPWGPAINFTQATVRTFFIENALYWLNEYRFDGLRFDAAHAIDSAPNNDFLAELAARVRASVPPGRHVHLVLEHDENVSSHIAAARYDAQWNDDLHHVLHVLLTGERDGYYADYADAPAQRLARCLAQGFAYQGEPSAYRDGATRGEPSAHLSPTCFVGFLQNHDQIGNRALGERLEKLVKRPEALEAAIALLLLSPHIPMIFMGEEFASEKPFLYFTAFHGELAEAVREGRRKEFARFAAFSTPEAQAAIPDPNAAETFLQCRLQAGDKSEAAQARVALYRELLARRRDVIVPALDGAVSLGADAVGAAAVRASWRLGDGRILQVLCNLGDGAVQVPPLAAARVVAAIPHRAGESVASGNLPACSTVWRMIEAVS